MSRSLTRLAKVAAVLAAAALIAALAGCGSDDSESEGTSAYGGAPAKEANSENPSASTAASSGAAMVGAAKVGGLGTILVNSRGFALYDFHKDDGTRSSCYGACAEAWPPLTTDGSPIATEGAMESKLGTTRRSDGTMQVTYAGHPLYTYLGDSKPGEANGNDVDAFGAEWYALRPNGQEPED
jgi:predicted lipoprotein with Yx(FWY)xxD motif